MDQFQNAVDSMMEDLVKSLHTVIDDLMIRLYDCFTELQRQEIDANGVKIKRVKEFLKVLKTKGKGAHIRFLDAVESFGYVDLAYKLREKCERAPGNLLTAGTASQTDVHVKSITPSKAIYS